MAVSPGGRPADDSSFGSGDNWVTRAGGLPKYVREVAHALVRGGMDESRAIATAISRLKVWAAGGDHVRPQVQAAAAKAIAEWEAKKGSHVNLSNEPQRYTHGWVPISSSSVSAALKRGGGRPVPRYHEGVSVSKSHEPTSVYVHSMILGSDRHEKLLADHAHETLEAAGYHVERLSDNQLIVRKPKQPPTDLSNVRPKGVHADLKQHYPPHVLKWVKGASWDKRTVPLGVIAMKSRPGKPHDAAKVDGMRKAIRAGKKFKPVVLVDTGKGPMQIADGYHRTRAHKLEGHSLIRAVVATNTASHGPWVKQMHDEKLNT